MPPPALSEVRCDRRSTQVTLRTRLHDGSETFDQIGDAVRFAQTGSRPLSCRRFDTGCDHLAQVDLKHSLFARGECWPRVRQQCLWSMPCLPAAKPSFRLAHAAHALGELRPSIPRSGVLDRASFVPIFNVAHRRTVYRSRMQLPESDQQPCRAPPCRATRSAFLPPRGRAGP